MATLWTVNMDGAARNNPGPAGAGVSIRSEGKPVFETGVFLGSKTNNQAEYIALLLAIFHIGRFAKSGDTVKFKSDSQLLVRQMSGEYRVKNPDLAKLKNAAVKGLAGIDHCFEHVFREQNTEADRLANVGIDKKISPPKPFLEFLQNVQSSLEGL